MRDPRRIPRMLALLQQRWKEQPDLRLGQLIEGVLNSHRGSVLDDHCIFHVEDDVTEGALRKGFPGIEPKPDHGPTIRLYTPPVTSGSTSGMTWCADHGGWHA